MLHFSSGYLVRLPEEGERFFIGMTGSKPFMATRIDGRVVVEMDYAGAEVSESLVSDGNVNPVFWKANQLSVWFQQRHPEFLF